MQDAERRARDKGALKFEAFNFPAVTHSRTADRIRFRAGAETAAVTRYQND